MELQELVGELIKTNDKKVQIRILRENSSLINIRLAEAIKDSCYSSWTSEPYKAHNAARALDVLYDFFQQDEVLSFVYWGKGISDLIEGKAALALENLENAARILREINQPLKAS